MPWKDVRPMDERVLFIADYLKEGEAFSSLCERFGVSRKTGYKWVKRYAADGLEGLKERSRRPHVCPYQVPFAVRQAVIALRTGSPDPPGPKKIQQLLRARFPEHLIPSKTTIYNILKAAGLIKPQRRRRRVPPQPSPFLAAKAPNDVWSTDFKGQFKTRDGRWCYPLTVMDHTSRYLLACQGLEGTRYRPSRTLFERLFRDYGLPRRIRSDNGVPFATAAIGGLSRLSIWWIRLGIVPERIEPGQPQQNGRHERMHRTLKRAVSYPVSANMRQQQQQFDHFREQYNQQRPHEALGQRCPASCFVASPRPFPSRLPELDYPSYFEIRQVAHNGTVHIRNRMAYVGYLLYGEQVGLEQVDQGIWDVHFGPLRLGRLNERQAVDTKVPYMTLRL